jgi:hypothetical protein
MTYRHLMSNGADEFDVVPVGANFFLRADLAEAASKLHIKMIRKTIEAGEPGTVTLDLLDEIPNEQTDLVDELDRSGLWKPIERGYLIMDAIGLNALVNPLPEYDCLRARGHVPKSGEKAITLLGAHEICDVCGKILFPDDPIRPS